MPPAFQALRASSYAYGVSFLAGALLVLGFSPFDFFLMSLLGPALFFALTVRQPAWRAWKLGFCFGLGLFGFGVSWVYVSIARYGNTNILVAGLMTLAFVMTLALFPAFQAYCAKRFFRSHLTLQALFVFPGLFVVSEGLRSTILTGFPWLLLGYAQTFHALSGYAKCFSVYGVTWVTACASGLLVLLANEIVSKPKTRLPLYAGSLLFLALLAGGVLLKQAVWTTRIRPSFRVALVQGNIPQSTKWSPAALNSTLLTYAKLTGPILDTPVIVWPENAIPDFPENVMPFLNEMDQSTALFKSAIVFGIPIDNPTNQTYFNGALALGDANGMYLKRHLVPFGEYVPFGLHFLYALLRLPMSNFTAGPMHQEPFLVQGLPVSVLICYESAYPLLVRNLNNAAYIITLSDDTWFGDSLGPYQHEEIEAMRAIETERFILRDTNSGVTSIIGPMGDVVASLPLFQAGVLQGRIHPVLGETPWQRWGIGPLIFFLILTLGVCFKPWASRSR